MNPLENQMNPFGNQMNPLENQINPLGNQMNPVGNQMNPLGNTSRSRIWGRDKAVTVHSIACSVGVLSIVLLMVSVFLTDTLLQHKKHERA